MAEITVSSLHKSFGDFVAVRDSSFTVKDGEFFVMLGPSGCGKTTTLRMIAGLEMPSSGAIHLDGDDVTFLRGSQRDIAFVFQLFALYPHMNVRQNISFPLRVQRLPRKEVRRAHRGGRPDAAHRPPARASRSTGFRAATGSASRSAARSCAAPRHSCSTSRSARSMRSSGT